MSIYRKYREAPFNDEWKNQRVVPVAFEVMDQIEQLWKTTGPKYDIDTDNGREYGYMACPSCFGESERVRLPLLNHADHSERDSVVSTVFSKQVDHESDCPHEALRGLFGEETR